MKKLLLILLFIPLVSFGQKSNDADALKLCVALQSNNFTTDAEAENAVNKILSVIGVSQKPILQACSNINNAVAAVFKGKRYVLYDREFMNSLTRGANKYWANMFILAHEIGHHVNGHSLDILLYANDIIDPKSLSVKREQELEADEFAGFVLTKLGASFSDISNVLSNLPKINNENRSTHPSKDKRIAAVKKGFGESDIYNIDSKKLNYSIIVSNDNDLNAVWDNVVNKVKELKLSSVSDPFERLEIINDDNIPEIENNSWVYGKILKNDLIQYEEPQLILVQFKYDGKEMDYYNDMEIAISNPYFEQKIYNEAPINLKKTLYKSLRNEVYEFDFVFDDGYSGKLKSVRFGEENWDLYISLESYSDTRLEIRKNIYSIFINKLQTQKKLFLRLSKLPHKLQFYDSENALKSLQATDFYSELIENNLSELIKTIEFDLTGSSKALSF